MSKFTMDDFPGPEDWKRIRDAEAKERNDAAWASQEALERLRRDGERQQAETRRFEMECIVDEAISACGIGLSTIQREFAVELVDSMRRAWFPEPTFDRNWVNTAKVRGR